MEKIKKLIDDEEISIVQYLDEGKALFERTVKASFLYQVRAGNKFPGDVAWRLFEIYSLPIDLTQLMAAEKGLPVDLLKYEKCKQKASASYFLKLKTAGLLFVTILGGRSNHQAGTKAPF